MKKRQMTKLALLGLAGLLFTGSDIQAAVATESNPTLLAGGCGAGKCSSQSARTRRYDAIALEDQPVNAQGTFNYGPMQGQQQGNQPYSQSSPVSRVPAQPNQSTGNWSSTQGQANYSHSPQSNSNNWNPSQPNHTQNNVYGGQGPEQGYFIEEDAIEVTPYNNNGPQAYNNQRQNNKSWNNNNKQQAYNSQSSSYQNYYSDDATATDGSNSSLIWGSSNSGKNLTEQDLKSQLNQEGLKQYNSLDAEGKALALKLANGSCQGKNDCKGLSSCKNSDHSCAGQNSCKGSGNAKFADKNLAVKIAAKKQAEKRSNTMNTNSKYSY